MSDRNFWLAVLGAVVVKLVLSPTVNWLKQPLEALLRAMLTGIPAVWAAWIFTDPALAITGWEPEHYRNVVAAVIAIAGENIIRRLIKLSASETAIADLLKLWRGK